MREAATICPDPCKLTFDLLILKVVSESCVTWLTSVPILVFPGLSVLDLGQMYATDVRRASSLNAPNLWGGGIITVKESMKLQLGHYSAYIGQCPTPFNSVSPYKHAPPHVLPYRIWSL